MLAVGAACCWIKARCPEGRRHPPRAQTVTEIPARRPSAAAAGPLRELLPVNWPGAERTRMGKQAQRDRILSSVFAQVDRIPMNMAESHLRVPSVGCTGNLSLNRRAYIWATCRRIAVPDEARPLPSPPTGKLSCMHMKFMPTALSIASPVTDEPGKAHADGRRCAHRRQRHSQEVGVRSHAYGLSLCFMSP